MSATLRDTQKNPLKIVLAVKNSTPHVFFVCFEIRPPFGHGTGAPRSPFRPEKTRGKQTPEAIREPQEQT